MLFLFGIGGAGAWLFLRLRLPAPSILGSLFAVALTCSLGLKVAFPTGVVSFFSKVTIGAFIGLRFDRNCTKLLRDLAWPSIIVSLWMLGTSIGCGMLLYLFTDLPISTALLGSTAGGVAEMALLALSLGADVASVTLLQTFRLVGSMFVMPLLGARYAGGDRGSLDEELPPCSSSCDSSDSSPWRYATFVGLALLGGWVGTISHVPAGSLLGSMFLVGVFCALGIPMWSPPKIIRSIAQTGVGITIGLSMTEDTFRQLYFMLPPVLLLTGGMIACAVALGFLLKRITGWDLVTCLLSASPAGLTQMGAIADEMGADPLIVSLMHTVRLVSILIVMPFSLSALLS